MFSFFFFFFLPLYPKCPPLPPPKQTLPIIVVKCQSLDLITPGNKEHGWWPTNEDKRTIAGKGALNPNQFSIKFLSEMYIIGLGWNFNMCWWYGVYIYIYREKDWREENVTNTKCRKYVLFYFWLQTYGCFFCVNIFWIWENIFFLSFFFSVFHKHKVNLPQAQSEPSYKSMGRGTRRTYLGCFLFFPKLSNPSIILYLVLPKIIRRCMCMCTTSLQSQIDAFLP